MARGRSKLTLKDDSEEDSGDSIPDIHVAFDEDVVVGDEMTRRGDAIPTVGHPCFLSSFSDI